MAYDGSPEWVERFEALAKNTAKKIRKLVLRWRLTIKVTISFWRTKE